MRFIISLVALIFFPILSVNASEKREIDPYVNIIGMYQATNLNAEVCSVIYPDLKIYINDVIRVWSDENSDVYYSSWAELLKNAQKSKNMNAYLTRNLDAISRMEKSMIKDVVNKDDFSKGICDEMADKERFNAESVSNLKKAYTESKLKIKK